jgi:putative transport protein
MAWIGGTLAKYPELAVFLVVGVGYWIGAFKAWGFGLGSVTGSLLVGLLVGAFFEVPVSSTAKSILFLLFLFSIGYSAGPQFFKAMKGDGIRWALLAIVIACSGLAAAFAVARLLGLDPGFAGGLLAGALTQSPAIGTATEAINTLPLPEEERNRLIGHVAVADALCYVFGAFGVIVFCSIVAPRLLRIDLKPEAERVERELGIDRTKPGAVSAWRPFEMRAYRVSKPGRVAGLSVAQLESVVPNARIFVERIRRDGRLMEPVAEEVIHSGDIVVLSARREVLTEIIGRAGAEEVEDREALDVATVSYDVFVTARSIVGTTLRDIAKSDISARSVFLRGITRRGLEIPVAPGTTIERGDVLRLTGPEHAVMRVAKDTGEVVMPTDATDFVTLCIGIFAGALLGIAIIVPLGTLRISVGTSVGTLIAGLVVGYLHSMRPMFGRIPDGAVALMISLGLAAFVAMIGLGAGPHFVEALHEAGLGLFVGGIAVTSLPLIVGLYFGRYVLKLDPLLLLGGIAGALTTTAALAAVQERSGSSVAVLGYSGTVAIAHILLTTWGTVIVRLA